jgi:undecaprenyl diphosphate synthase
MSLLAALGDSASSSLPRHVAIIMDGNGRWAQNRGKMRVSGHKAGVKSVREAVAFAARAKMEALTLFAFSSENWRRPEGEVNALMELFMTVLGREVSKLHSNGIRLRVIGDTARFSERLQAKIAKAEALTANNQGLTLNIAANYGGQWDIAQAARPWHAPWRRVNWMPRRSMRRHWVVMSAWLICPRGSVDPHRRGSSHQQLCPVAARLCRTLFYPGPVARF